MAIIYTMQLTGATPDAAPKIMPRVTKEALARVLRWWHAILLKEHFKPGAAAKYGYKPRSPRYLARKKRKLGHTIPLVHSGLMRRSLTRAIFVTGTSRLLRGTMHGPRYVHMRTTIMNPRPNLGDEAARTTAEEQRSLAAVFGAAVAELLNAEESRRTIVIR